MRGRIHVNELLGQRLADVATAEAGIIVLRLVLAALLGRGVAWVYRSTKGRSEMPPTFPITLVLLAVLIAMVTQVIGDNVARAFSLVGALAIVRFRTVVRDTRDTAFVIFAVVVGMAAGAGDLVVAGAGIVIVSAAAFLMAQKRTAAETYLLRLRIGLGHDVDAVVGATLDLHMPERRLVAMSTARQGLAVDVSYQGPLQPGTFAEAFVRALNRHEGVQQVELSRPPMPEE